MDENMKDDVAEHEGQAFNNENPNWQFVGKLKNISVFNKNNKVFSWITTSTTFFAIEGVVPVPVHSGQTVKLSKKDNAAKIGGLLVYRPELDELNCAT